MAKGQKRGNREHKKPKQLKPKTSVSPFAIAQAKTAASPHQARPSSVSLDRSDRLQGLSLGYWLGPAMSAAA